MYFEKYLQVIFVNFWVLVYDDDYVIDFGAIHAHILNRKSSFNTWARAQNSFTIGWYKFTLNSWNHEIVSTNGKMYILSPLTTPHLSVANAFGVLYKSGWYQIISCWISDIILIALGSQGFYHRKSFCSGFCSSNNFSWK